MTGRPPAWPVALRAGLAALLLLPGAARAGTTTLLDAGLYARLNPIGFAVTSDLARRWDRADGDSPLARGRYLQAGVGLVASPDAASVLAAVEWVPVAVLQLGGGYRVTGYPGQFGSLLRFDGPDARFGHALLQSRRGEERRGVGHRLQVSPVLRARLGRLILRNETTASWYHLPGPGWTYESEHDTLLAADDWLLQERAGLLVEARRGPEGATLLAGSTWELTRAVRAGVVRQRLSGLALWTPPVTWLGFRPRLLLVVGVNLRDRNRGGEPFALAGFGGQWTLGRSP